MKLKNILPLMLACAIVGSSGITPVSAAEGDDFTVTASTSSVNLDAGGEISVTATPNYTVPSTGSNGEAVTATRTVIWTSGNTSYVTAARTDTATSGASTAKLTAGALNGVAAGTAVSTAVTASFTYTLHHDAVTVTTGYQMTEISASEYYDAYYDDDSSDWIGVPAVNDTLFIVPDRGYAYNYIYSKGFHYYKYLLENADPSDYDLSYDGVYYKLAATTATYAAYDETKTGSAAIAVNVTQTASTSGSTTQTKTVTAQHNPDGTVKKTADGDTIYDLALTFSGETKTFVQKQKVDVLFVVDVSGSMSPSVNDSKEDRITAAKNAVKTFITQAAAKQLDAKYALVTFSGYGNGTANQDARANSGTSSNPWVTVDNTDTAKSAFAGMIALGNGSYYTNNGWEANGGTGLGTNYQAGLMQAGSVLSNANTRTDAKQIVVFLTDGQPTLHYDGSNCSQTGPNGGAGTDYDDWYNATQQMNGLTAKADYFFAVGIGSATSNYLDSTSQSGGTYTGLLHYLHSGCTGSVIIANTSGLSNIFSGIINGTTSIPCRNVTITDELSGNIGFYNPAGAEIASLITVSRVNNTTNAATDITAACTVSYNAATHKITVTLPNDNSDGSGIDSACTYKVTYPITASDSAKGYYAEHGTYPDTADTQTGDYSGQQGFYTNVEDTGTAAAPNGTYVTYTSGSTTTNTAYRMPVIQINTGTITVNKTFTGLADGVEKPAVTFTATASTLKKADGTAFTKRVSVIESSGSYTAAFTNLPYDTYTITEDGGTGNVENYTCTVTNGSSNVTLSSANSLVNVTNTYMHDNDPDTPYITVTKTFSGITADSIPSDFSITVKDGAAEIATLNGSSVNLTKSADELTWTWKVELDPALFKDLASKTFTVTENNAKITDYTLAASINGTAVTPAADGSVTGTATVRPSQISFNITNKVPNCNEQTFNVGKDVTFIAAQLTESYGYFVWTKEELTANERIAAVAYIRAQNEGFTQATLSNTYFFHGDSLTGNQYLVFRDAQVRYDLSNGKLIFSATKQWTKFFYGTYNDKNGDNPEMTFTNTYALQTLTLTLKKVDGDTNMPLAGAKFQLSRWDGTAWTAYVSASNATGEYTVVADEGVALSDLPNGNYKLTESYVPAGYTKAADIYFQTSGGTSAALTDANRTEIASQTGVTLDGTNLILTAANYKNGFALPETGGAGTAVFRVIGIAILVCAVAGLVFYLIKSRKKKPEPPKNNPSSEN